MKDNKFKIILVGGGTAGSVSPLLAIKTELEKKYQADFLFLGSKNGPEKSMAENAKINFQAICSGKLRRYFDIQNFFDLFKIKFAFWQSLFILQKFKPDYVLTAGSFVAVPVAFAAYFLGIKVLVHQQDVRPGLANKLMSFYASIITVVFNKSLEDYGKKAFLVANPIRQEFFIKQDKAQPKKYFNLSFDLPVVLFFGGGTGAAALSDLAFKISQSNNNFQILLITGENLPRNIVQNKNIFIKKFLNPQEMAMAYVVADVVVSRAGMGALSEISFLKKQAILIPMPNSHQEDNAEEFAKADSAVVLSQNNLTPEILTKNIFDLLKKPKNIRQVVKTGSAKDIVDLL